MPQTAGTIVKRIFMTSLIILHAALTACAQPEPLDPPEDPQPQLAFTLPPARPTKQPIEPPPRQPTFTLPPAKPSKYKPQEPTSQAAGLFANPFDEFAANFSDKQIAGWAQIKLNNKQSRVSPVIVASPGFELNHHRITVDYTGSGTVELSFASAAKNDRQYVLSLKNLRPFAKLTTGREVVLQSPYKGENHAWILLRTTGDVRVRQIRYRAMRGRNTLYGHTPARFTFARAFLPYRILAPKRIDPNKRYPLVITISGSGGIGTDNHKNMEMVGLSTYLFRDYFDDPQFACYSITPQIAPPNACPAPYWPKGSPGKPTPAHPDHPLVNADGWYAQAVLALIHQMLADPAYRIDPDRVYLTGFSYGGKAVWEFLRADPNTFAAAISAGGWAIGQLDTNPSATLQNILAQEAQAYKHLPILVTAGQNDIAMSKASRFTNQILTKIGADCTYVEFPNTQHVPSAGKTWGNRTYITWLFQQHRTRKTLLLDKLAPVPQ